MMLTIRGLPPSTKFKDLKVLIRAQCNLNNFILDDLVVDMSGLKTVRIGLADAMEGDQLIKCLDGYRMAGCVLSVTPVAKTSMPGPGPQQNQNFGQPHNDYQGNNYNDSRPSPWGQQNQQNQWQPNPVGQGPQNTFGYQQQGPPMQNNQYIPPQQHQNQMQHHNQPQNFHPNQQYNLPSQQMHPGPQQMQKPFPHRDQFQGNRGPQDQANRGPPDQGYGFQAKNNMPEPTPPRSHVLRTVELVDSPLNRPTAQPNRYSGQGYPPQDKPMTISKDNFQGPSQYNLGQGSGPSQGPSKPWTQQQQAQKGPAFVDPKRPPIKPQGPDRFKDYDKDFEPLSPDQQMRKSPFRKDSPGRGSPRRHSPRRMSPGRRSPRRMSPGRRSPRRMPPGRMSPRRLSPGRRSPIRVSPGRRSPVRGMSPGRRSPGRRVSPGHRALEHERRSPGRMGPAMGGARPWAAAGRRGSPPKRSPDRRPDPGSLRYSPSRRLEDKPEDFLDRAGNKTVRPAYEPPSQAANQAMYPGGYGANVQEKVQYPAPGLRPGEARDSSWQQERDKAMFNEVLKKREEERNTRMPFERPGIRPDKEQRSHSPRKSRSPLRRDKSPSRDPFKRHSPSPRSPRRSWALEKRRSRSRSRSRSSDLGDAPPPPIWPGQILREEKRPAFKEVETKRKPVWEYKKDIPDAASFPTPEGIRVRRDLGPIAAPERREELAFKSEDRFPREVPKFNPRDDFDKKVTKFNSREEFEKKVSLKFSPRDDFEKKGPKFSPRDDFDKRPKFSPREDFVKVPKFSPRADYEEPKFSRDDLVRKDPKYGHDFERPKFSPRDDHEDRRDDFRKHDLSDWKPREVPLKQPEREVYRGDFPKRDEPSRIELRRDVLRKMSEELDKQFEDVHKRAQDFHKRAEEFRRDDRRRDYDREQSAPAPFDDRRDYRRTEDWNTDEHLKNKAIVMAAIKAKKEKAAQEISQKILDKHSIDFEDPQNARICEDLRVSVGRIINEMFGDSDVSFIELVIKFNAKYSGAGEDKILRDVMANFPTQFRPKRTAPDYSEVPAKRSRRTPEPELNREAKPISATRVPEWDMTRDPAMVPAPAPAPAYTVVAPAMHPMMYPSAMPAPMMVPAPLYPSLPEPQYLKDSQQDSEQDGFSLYLCKSDFEPFSDLQENILRQFLINQIVGVTESSHGWAPDFTFKGLQGSCRFELHTRDEASKDWLVNFNFSIFNLFDILVYTKEELWYERAAIWLPGHSRYRSIEPITKIKLQNKKLDGVNVGKWKFVKKIVTTKGTRVYVDMPPSAARALEKHKMSLSYELQKVNVFLKAAAVDKNVFDLGLKDRSITNESDLANAVMNTPMPSLANDPKVVKIGIKGDKPLDISQARKIRERLIYELFKYHQDDGRSRTDFIKHGIVTPGYLGVLPENSESKRWLTRFNFGKLGKQPIVVLGAEDSNIRYINMTIVIPFDPKVSSPFMVLERLKHSNKGVKGLNINKWIPRKLIEEKWTNKWTFEVDIDIESVETIVSMKYKLDYVDRNIMSVQVKYHRSERHLLDTIKKYKMEIHDTYDNANMDLASSDSENGDVIHLE